MQKYIVCFIFSFFLSACQNNIDDNNFEKSGRSIQQIIDDVEKGKYDKSINILEVVAFDLCDCLTHIDFEILLKRMDEVELYRKMIAEGKKPEPLSIVNDKQIEGFSRIEACSVLAMSNRYEGYKPPEQSDSLENLIKLKCPELVEKFLKISNHNSIK